MTIFAVDFQRAHVGAQNIGNAVRPQESSRSHGHGAFLFTDLSTRIVDMWQKRRIWPENDHCNFHSVRSRRDETRGDADM
jgi:hypothetical protein